MSTTYLEYQLRRTLQRAIAEMIDAVLDLPHRLTIRDWTCEELQVALVKSRNTVGAVRFLASEFVEQLDFNELELQSVQAMKYATQICDQLEAEVEFVESELMTYAQ
jgi:hypothetical protein